MAHPRSGKYVSLPAPSAMLKSIRFMAHDPSTSMRRNEVILPRLSGRHPDHLVFARLRTTYGTVNRVLCQVFLPQTNSEELSLKFYPKPSQVTILSVSPWFSLLAAGKQKGRGLTIRAEEVWSSGLSRGFQDGISFATTFDGRPTWLEIVNRQARSPARMVKGGVFRITESPVLNTAVSILRSYTGAVKVKTVSAPVFTLRNGLRLKFRKHFDTAKNSTGDMVTTSCLTAEFTARKPLKKSDFPKAVDEFGEYLNLVSFAARYRCVCFRWVMWDRKGCLTTHYAQNVSRPTEKIPDSNETLIDIEDFPEFVRHAYREYIRMNSHDLLDNAIFALVSEPSTVEDRFLRYFLGLESVLSHFFRSQGGTNRAIQVHDVFISFQQKNQIDFTDLWPLTNHSAGVSLKELRNRIAHGIPVTPGQIKALIYAAQNLRWILERSILGILRWPISRSKVRSEFLRLNLAARDWKSVINCFSP